MGIFSRLEEERIKNRALQYAEAAKIASMERQKVNDQVAADRDFKRRMDAYNIRNNMYGVGRTASERMVFLLTNIARGNGQATTMETLDIIKRCGLTKWLNSINDDDGEKPPVRQIID